MKLFKDRAADCGSDRGRRGPRRCVHRVPERSRPLGQSWAVRPSRAPRRNAAPPRLKARYRDLGAVLCREAPRCLRKGADDGGGSVNWAFVPSMLRLPPLPKYCDNAPECTSRSSTTSHRSRRARSAGAFGSCRGFRKCTAEGDGASSRVWHESGSAVERFERRSCTGMRRMALDERKSSVSVTSTRAARRHRRLTPKFAVCINNSEYPASLELHKIYRVVSDEEAMRQGDLRVVDESGEDYLYPAAWFVPLGLPSRVRGSLLRRRRA